MSYYLSACREAALAGGRAIAKFRPDEPRTKDDAYVGQHAVVSEADYKSQTAILETLARFDNSAWVITEEAVATNSLRDRRLTPSDVALLPTGKAFIIDELDGSSSHAIEHYEWSISVAYLENLTHMAGAIFAPVIFNGLLFFSSFSEGAFMEQVGGHPEPIKIPTTPRPLKDAYILVGPDSFLTRYPLHNSLLTLLGDACRTVNSNGSCALALGLVAAGRTDALVQPLQAPWDWAAGKLLVEEAGGTILFYELSKGQVVPVKKLEPHHYDPTKRAVGFVAGHQALAAEILDRLISLQPQSVSRS